MSARVFTAFFLRELHAAVVGRSIHIFWVLSLIAGCIPLGGGQEGSEIYFLLQGGLYLIPLFSLLVGIGSAQNETEERAFLMSQPVPAASRLLGKFIAVWIIAMIGVVLLTAPIAFSGIPDGLLFLGIQITSLAGIFIALGLAAGFSTTDRLRAYLSGFCLWLALLVGTDLLALVTAQNGFAANSPNMWIALLMGNPMDAFRIGSLLEIGKIPFEMDTLPPLGRWWLGNPALWYALLSLAWISLSLAWAGLRLEQRRT